MTRNEKTAAIIIALLLVSSVVMIMLFDWNLLRGYVEKEVSARSGRACSIGYLDVDLSLTPRIHLKEVKLGNAPWGKEKWMLDVQALEFTVDAWKLFSHPAILPDVVLSHPTIALEVSADGKRNWILKPDQTPEDRAPVIKRLRVDTGEMVFRDPAIGADIRVAINTDSANPDPKSVVKFHAQGKFKGLNTQVQGQGGSILSLRDEALPYPIKASIQIGDTYADIDGTVRGLASLAALELAIRLRGQDMSKLYPLIGIVVPPTPPYSVNGHLSHHDNVWNLNGFTGRVGDSDLSGSVAVDTTNARPKLTGDATSRVLDIDDLAGFIGAPPKTGPGETASAAQKQAAIKTAEAPRVLPDTEFRLGRLKAMDADVRLKAASIRRKELPLDNILVHAILDNGLLKLKPLNFGVAGGQIVSDIALNGQGDKLKADARFNFNRLRLDKLFPGVALTRTSVGTLSGRAGLSGEGNSFAKLVGSANGEIAAVMTGGKISNLLLEIAGIDGAEIIKFLLGGDHNVDLRCAVADFGVTTGLMNTKVFVIDTTDTNITGEGTIDLKNETLNLRLIPLPKDKSFLAFRSPLHATGTFKNPAFAPDKGVLAARGGAAVLIGALVNPVAALIPLIETGPGKDSDCRGLIAMATRDMAKAEKGR